jgi:hypothetical protein
VRGRRWIKIVVVFASVAAAAGLFVVGRLTAGAHVRDRGYEAGRSDGHAIGLREGRAQGRQEGRALQVARSSSPDTRKAIATAFNDGYAAGANDVFAGYDGGWGLSTPYLVTLGRGGGAITYRIDSRTQAHEGVNYYLCPRSRALCREPRR